MVGVVHGPAVRAVWDDAFTGRIIAPCARPRARPGYGPHVSVDRHARQQFSGGAARARHRWSRSPAHYRAAASHATCMSRFHAPGAKSSVRAGLLGCIDTRCSTGSPRCCSAFGAPRLRQSAGAFVEPIVPGLRLRMATAAALAEGESTGCAALPDRASASSRRTMRGKTSVTAGLAAG
jgi:hypothetical protein